METQTNNKKVEFIFQFISQAPLHNKDARIRKLSYLLRQAQQNPDAYKENTELQKQIVNILIVNFIGGNTITNSFKQAVENETDDLKKTMSIIEAQKALSTVSKGAFSSFNDLYYFYVKQMLKTGQLLNFRFIAKSIHAERKRGRIGSIVEFNLVAWALQQSNMQVKIARSASNKVIDILNNYTELKLSPFSDKEIQSRKHILSQSSTVANVMPELQELLKRLFSSIA